jgi:hypothetical protein
MSHYLDMHEENLRCNTPYGPQVPPAGLDPAPSYPALARAETSDDPLASACYATLCCDTVIIV